MQAKGLGNISTNIHIHYFTHPQMFYSKAMYGMCRINLFPEALKLMTVERSAKVAGHSCDKTIWLIQGAAVGWLDFSRPPSPAHRVLSFRGINLGHVGCMHQDNVRLGSLNSGPCLPDRVSAGSGMWSSNTTHMTCLFTKCLCPPLGPSTDP